MASLRRVLPYRATAVAKILKRSKEEAAIGRAAAAARRVMVASSTRKVVVASDRSCDVFLSHRGVDTKKSLAGLLYDRLVEMNVKPFLDNRSMQPGDKLYECIDAGIRQSKVGVAIFSPRYCDSVFCLHELAMMVESQKKLIPVFCDVKPSELLVKDAAAYSPEDLNRYMKAIQEAKLTVGLTFDSKNGNWSNLVSRTAKIVLKCMKDERDR
ncbi:protein VARIATION IN COMPOUND TRIGGERED ROOT growth response-like [Canna indica]|uniref:Protein VARIATION IN COMPOUND TRIGGERED ROOT growth response-like n=1 Tax=Canna indica TaxID=4628 RepID=A0AAQ3JLM1_9LILI|nr:protein VARIATION IN COMPOUND TRIGGERED ROOT growth response-like [Canna indica]